MLLIGLLLIAAVLVGLGVFYGSVPLVIASLVASALAAAVMLYSYLSSRRRAAKAASPTTVTPTASASTSDSSPGIVGNTSASSAPATTGVTAASTPPATTAPDNAAPDTASPDTASPGTASPDNAPLAATSASRVESDVVVIDGQPLFHLLGCVSLSPADATEPIPLSQAVEDGFEACSVCRPLEANAQPAPAQPSPVTTVVSEPAPLVGATTSVDEVWVVDGHPDFHIAGCVELQRHTSSESGGSGEAIPRSQAHEDGFAACPICQPDIAPVAPASGSPSVASTAPPADFAADEPQVWVADGFPEYHVQGCSELAGLTDQAVPYEQAIEDGFQPCVVCDPDRQPVADSRPPITPVADFADPVTVPAATASPVTDERTSDDENSKVEAMATQVWVVDGFPDYHRSDCPRVDGAGSEAIPHDQAVEDGFAACTTCQPEAAEAPSYSAPDSADSAVPEPADTAQAPGTPEVLVIDGFPDYHRGDCPRLTGMDSEAVPHDQAVEDGFS